MAYSIAGTPFTFELVPTTSSTELPFYNHEYGFPQIPKFLVKVNLKERVDDASVAKIRRAIGSLRREFARYKTTSITIPSIDLKAREP